MGKKLPDDVRLEIARLYSNGMGTTEISRVLGVSAEGAIGTLKKMGIPRRLSSDYRPVTGGNRMADIGERYKAGETLQQIAESYGSCDTTILRQLRRMGIKTRSRIRCGEQSYSYRGGPRSHRSAMVMVCRRIKDGRMVRPSSCEKCGRSGTCRNGTSIVWAHHCDYNKPFDVMWLCPKCHHEWHKHNRAIPKRKAA